MQFSVRPDSPPNIDCAIVPIFSDSPPTKWASRFDRKMRGRIVRARRSGEIKGKPGQTLLLRDTGGKGTRDVLLVGCGAKRKFGVRQLASATMAAAAALAGTSVRSVASYICADPLPGLDAYTGARTMTQALRGSAYRFTEQKSKPDRAPPLSRAVLVVIDKESVDEARLGVRHGEAIANGMDLARNLGNRSPNLCTPTHLADTARQLAAEHGAMKARILNEPDIQKLGMGALLSVTGGAAEPARFIILEHSGGGKGEPPVVLCGKGITFDTGGISLKPPPKMDEMKFDMCGAAAVLGTMRTVADLDLPLNVVALVPTCENMPGGRATRPGDIVTSMSGQTIEILNTDAEGRLILCDAITYAHGYEPRAIIDVATLTGACVVALGGMYTGVFSRDESLVEDLIGAGRRTGDPGWRLPVDEEYGESLRSNFADFANSGAREGGASVAAQFLSRFVKGVPWAHLDIAGVAWKQNADKGATGRPVPLLVDYLIRTADDD